MKRMTNDEVHSVNLEILKYIHQYCQENGYTYSIGWGTLIGAIRHKGFIPWDDDSDIMMPRPDYDRFVNEYKDTAKYRLYAPQRRNSGLAYARLCEMENTYFGEENPWTKEFPGVGVDIFPIDSLSDDYNRFLKDTEILAKMRNDTFRLRRCTKMFSRKLSSSFPIVQNIKNLIFNILSVPLRIGAWSRLYCLLDRMDKLMRKYPYGSTKHTGWAASIDGRGAEWADIDWFKEFELVDFCDTKLNALKDADRWLRNYYGDYMSLPPEAERKGHAAIQTMYWRNK